jgi:hypothetical protein
MSADTWGEWTKHASKRHMVKLIDGRVCELIAVHRVPRSCRVRLYGRHYYCWVEDIAFVSERVSVEASLRPAATHPWVELEPWRIVDLDSVSRGVHIRSSRAAPSKSWLQVVRNPEAIASTRTHHPS